MLSLNGIYLEKSKVWLIIAMIILKSHECPNLTWSGLNKNRAQVNDFDTAAIFYFAAPVYYTPASPFNEVEGGGGILVSSCPSICPPVFPLCIFHNTSRIHLFTHLLQAAWRVLSVLKN